jgi:hypothetical protein
MRTAILVILMTGAAASALAMRLNPLAVSSSIEDRRGGNFTGSAPAW